MKLLFERWNRFLKESLDRQEVEELLNDFETNNPELISNGMIDYGSLEIGENAAVVNFIFEVNHPDHKLRASIEQVKNKFMQDYAGKVQEYDLNLTFTKDKYRDELVIEYRIPIQVYNDSVHENLQEKINNAKEFEDEVVESFIDENPEMFGSMKQYEVPLGEERKLGKPSSEKNLGDWFKRKGAPGKTGGWVDCNTCRDGKCKPCGRQEGEKRGKYPRCRPTPAQCKGYKRRHSNIQEEQEDYRGEHTAPDPDNAAPLWDVTKNGVYPEDFYSTNSARYYGDGQPSDSTVVNLIQNYKNKPKAKIKIYRAVPNEPSLEEQIAELEMQKRHIMKTGQLPKNISTPLDPSAYYNHIHKIINKLNQRIENGEQPEKLDIKDINSGDWVTIYRPYAKEHGIAALKGKYKILSKIVKANEIFTDGNSIYEWGYHP